MGVRPSSAAINTKKAYPSSGKKWSAFFCTDVLEGVAVEEARCPRAPMSYKVGCIVGRGKCIMRLVKRVYKHTYTRAPCSGLSLLLWCVRALSKKKTGSHPHRAVNAPGGPGGGKLIEKLPPSFTQKKGGRATKANATHAPVARGGASGRKGGQGPILRAFRAFQALNTRCPPCAEC